MPDRIAPQGRALDSQAKALQIARVAIERQAEGVAVMDLRALSTVTDFFVICTAGSSRQIEALKDHIEEALRQQGQAVWHTEGVVSGRTGGTLAETPQWLLMDCGEVVVHLLDGPARAFYRLEELWADAPRIALDS